jgi:hypothetical protein
MRENLDRREQKNGEGKRVTKTVAQKIEARDRETEVACC